MEKHYFFGSNTPSGFRGEYGHITNGADIIILKGGAGTGKSTLMRKVADACIKNDMAAELYHCSSDIKSLDCVYIPSLNRAVVDGTPPHVIEATHPLTRHFVFNLLDKADYNKLKPFKAAIENCVNYKKQYFKNTYCYLKCAYELQSNLDAIIAPNIRDDKIEETADNIFSLISDGGAEKHDRRFLSAITDKGIADYYNETLSDCKTVAVDYEFEVQYQRLLKRLIFLLDAHNVRYTLFISPFSAGAAEGLKTGGYAVAPRRFINDPAFKFDLELSLKSFNRHFAATDTPVIEDLISKAIRSVNYAHLTHMEIEKFYYEAMDWEDINDKTNRIINLILNF